MTEVRICWALNKNLQRCDMPAGHPGDHAIQTTWTDADCYNPAVPTPVSNPGTVTAGAPVLPVTEVSEPPVLQAVPPCAACQHRHKGGPCKCGCYEYIG